MERKVWTGRESDWFPFPNILLLCGKAVSSNAKNLYQVMGLLAHNEEPMTMAVLMQKSGLSEAKIKKAIEEMKAKKLLAFTHEGWVVLWPTEEGIYGPAGKPNEQ